MKNFETKYSQMRAFLKTVREPKNFVLPVLAAVATGVCLFFNFAFEMRLVSLVFFGGIFFVFAVVMNTADRRRFAIFDELGQIKGLLLSISHISKFQNISEKELGAIRSKLAAIWLNLQKVLSQNSKKSLAKNIKTFDQSLAAVAEVAEILEKKGFSTPEVSRLHQFLGQIYFSFEKILAIHEHRTPKLLRFFLEMSLLISVLFLAPEFAQMGIFGVFAAAAVGFILSILVRIQSQIEHPFHGQDFDDVSFAPRFLERILDKK